MADPAQPGDVGFQRFKDRIWIGRDRGFEHHFPFPVNHTDRCRFHSDVQSGKVFHGCPPLALGALTRPRFSTVIMGDSRPTSSNQCRILRLKPNYAGSSAVVPPSPPCHTAKHANTCDVVRNAVIPIMADSVVLTWARTGRRHAACWLVGMLFRRQAFVRLLHVGLSSNYRSTVCQTVGT